MIVKIAIVLIAILSIAAIVNSILSDSGSILQSETDETRSDLDCVMRNKDDTSDCRSDQSNSDFEGIEVKEIGV
jgi:hypothetical protein